MPALEAASRSAVGKYGAKQFKRLLLAWLVMASVGLLGLAAAPAASASSNPNQQVGIWRADYACQGFHHTHTYKVKYDYGSRGTYGYLRLYQKGRQICVVNLASARTMGKSLPRGITVFHGSGGAVIAHSYATSRHYVSLQKPLPSGRVQLNISAYVAFSRKHSDEVAQADLNITV